jgi:4-carboxymuconolactone decarboxylase
VPHVIEPPRAPRIAPVPPRADRPMLNIFATLSKDRDLARGFYALGGHLLQHGALAARDRELVILRTGYRSRAEYEFGHHRSIGADAGLSAEEIAATAEVGTWEWSGADRALLSLVDELCAENAVSAETWSLVSASRSEPEMLELLVLIGFYRLVSGMLNAVGVALEPGLEGWPEGSDVAFHAPRETGA